MKANKKAAKQWIRIAKAAISNGDRDKAIKFLDKSLKLYPTDEAKRKFIYSFNFDLY